MAELQGRGYLIAHCATYLKDKAGKDEWSKIHSQFSPELRQSLASEIKHAGWYPVAQLNEISKHIAASLGKNQDEASRKQFYECGRYCAAEATNTFLKMFLKLLSPALFVKKLPDVFQRDFSQGRLVANLNGNTLTCKYYDLTGFDHCPAYGPGFAAAALESMGKKINDVTLQDWSLSKPSVDGAGFTLIWGD